MGSSETSSSETSQSPDFMYLLLETHSIPLFSPLSFPHLSPFSPLFLLFPPVPPVGHCSFRLHLSPLFFCIALSLQPLTTTGHSSPLLPRPVSLVSCLRPGRLVGPGLCLSILPKFYFLFCCRCCCASQLITAKPATVLIPRQGQH